MNKTNGEFDSEEMLKLRIKQNKCECREHTKGDYRPEHGRSSITIICPFCNEHIKAYVMSLNGCGKRCSCGVMHSSRGYSFDDKNIYGNKEKFS
jgi:hypothetical protein